MTNQLRDLRLFFKSQLFRFHMVASGMLFGSWILFFVLEAFYQTVVLGAIFTVLSLMSLANLIASYFVYMEKFLQVLEIVQDLQHQVHTLSGENADLRSKLGVQEALINDALARQVEAEQVLAEDAHRRELARARDARYRSKKKRAKGPLQRVDLVAVLPEDDERDALGADIYDMMKQGDITVATDFYKTVPLASEQDENEVHLNVDGLAHNIFWNGPSVSDTNEKVQRDDEQEEDEQQQQQSA